MKPFMCTLAMIAACTLTGCMSPAPQTGTAGDSLQFSVLPTGKVIFQDKPIARESLVKTLRRAGATPATTFYVDIPATMPMSEVSALSRTLGSAGYRRVFYRRPKHTESGVTNP